LSFAMRKKPLWKKVSVALGRLVSGCTLALDTRTLLSISSRPHVHCCSCPRVLPCSGSSAVRARPRRLCEAKRCSERRG
jgi:hypothetical protein